MRKFSWLILLLTGFYATAQNNLATVNGVILDENDKPLDGVSVSILGKARGIASAENGNFSLQVPAEKAFALTFSITGYVPVQKNFFLSPGEQEYITVQLSRIGKTLPPVIITDDRERKEAGLIRVNPRTAIVLPSTTGGVEGLMKTLVGSNNELTSQYNVRGGNYDENLVYINDFEIYRPYLVSSGQQEGTEFDQS